MRQLFVTVAPHPKRGYQVKSYRRNGKSHNKYCPNLNEAKDIAETIAQKQQSAIIYRNTTGRYDKQDKQFLPDEIDSSEISLNNPLLINGDCLKEMNRLDGKSINLILVDLPYGTTQNKWDAIIPFDQMWDEFNRIITDNGKIVLTATQPFSSKLVMSNLDNFKYEIIWEKTIGSGQLNIKHQPLRVHESILIFYSKSGVYNEQKTEGTPYSIDRKVTFDGEGYGAQTDSSKHNDGFRHAKSVIKISNPRVKGGHPTQKPEALMEYLIKTYSNSGDTVLDCCMGSGTTGVASVNLNRKFIGIELDEKYFISAQTRINNLITKDSI